MMGSEAQWGVLLYNHGPFRRYRLLQSKRMCGFFWQVCVFKPCSWRGGEAVHLNSTRYNVVYLKTTDVSNHFVDFYLIYRRLSS